MNYTLPPLDFAQILGLIAMAIWIWSVSLKSDRRLNKAWLISNSFWVLHWILMGGWIGVANNFINIVRSGLYLIRDWRQTSYRWVVMWGLIAAFTLVTLPFVKHWSDFLPLSASIATCFAFFLFPGIRGRVIMMIGNVGWLIYGLVHQSYGGTLSAIAVIIISALTIFRLWRDDQKDLLPPE